MRYLSQVCAILMLVILLVACQPAPETPIPTSVPTAVTVEPTATPTPIPPRELVVCLGQEPNTLYPYGGPSAAARSVMSAIFDGPMDQVGYDYQPVILEKIPSLDDGDAFLEELQVFPGDLVVDVMGELVVLKAGVRVYPSGCQESECILEYDGGSSLAMDQLVVQFTLLPTLFWSDGTPLTAEDSVYSFNLAADLDTPVSHYLIDHTASYEALDDTTLEWRGLPGFVDPTYFINFWMPLPRHLWGEFSAAELLTSDLSVRMPVGWGPFIIEEWVAGEHIRLARNPNYFQAVDGLPRVDVLTYRFIGNPDAAITDLLERRCDLLDPSINLEGKTGVLVELERSQQIQVDFTTTTILERIDFGIRPASYDNGYLPASGDRPDLLGDRRTRQALALCMDRQQVVDKVLFGLAAVPDSFVPAEHPLYNPDQQQYPFDPGAANLLLEQVGWVDHDSNPATPRLAANVPGVPNGTPLVLTYATTSASQRQQVSELLASSLSRCGVQANLVYLSPAELYMEGPEGLLFGRKFDLAQYAISFAPTAFAGMANIEPPCLWFTSVEVPSEANRWIGTNVSGYANSAYDLACQSAMQALPDARSYAVDYTTSQSIFAADIPSVPLYFRLKVGAGRSDLCGFTVDPVSAMSLWFIENIDYGPGCQP